MAKSTTSTLLEAAHRQNPQQEHPSGVLQGRLPVRRLVRGRGLHGLAGINPKITHSETAHLAMGRPKEASGPGAGGSKTSKA
jgi:hypothetical protein